MRARRSDRGIVLFEVLVAVLLFALGCLAMAKTMETILHAEGVVRDQEGLARLVDSEMKALLENPTNPAESLERTERIAGREVVLSQRAEPLVLEREDHESVRLWKITVRAEAAGRQEQLTFWKQPNE